MSFPDEAGYGYDPEKDSETTEIFVFSPFHANRKSILSQSFPSVPHNHPLVITTKMYIPKLLLLTTSILTT